MFELEALRPVVGSFYISNAGAGRGRIVSVSCQVFRGHTLPIAWPFAAKSLSSKDETIESSLSSGEAVEWPFETQLARVDMAELAGTIQQKIGLYVVGRINYTDESDVLRTTGFCRRWNHDRGRFFPVDDPDYEYAD